MGNNKKLRDLLLNSDRNHCMGCSACASVCPVKAIVMSTDEYGYYIPTIDEEKCVKCGKCDNICPALNTSMIPERISNPEVYAMQMEDSIRMHSSSGGVFYSIGLNIIDTGGVVFGAAWDDDFNVHHICASTVNELRLLCGSKYVQSKLDEVFSSVRNLLLAKKTVLFSGTPCEIAGLYSFLGQDYNNLYTIDILCFYAPSVQIFKDYLSEEYSGSTIVECNMRDKQNGWTCEAMTVKLLDDSMKLKKEIRYRGKDSFETGFHKRIFMSEHCQKCRFSTMPRQGDISLGDFWQVKDYIPTMSDGKGTSVVIANSKKGNILVEKISGISGTRKERISMKCIDGNRVKNNMKTQRLDEAKRFYDLYPRVGYKRAVSLTMNNQYDIAIVGCWDIKNYGSHLTYWALYKTLIDMGYSVALVGCPQKAEYKSKNCPQLFRVNPYNLRDILEQYKTPLHMQLLNNSANTFIVGSDQVWKNSLYKMFGRFTLLDYIYENKKKIAYAASFGDTDWHGTSIERDKFAFLLNRFNAISVREKSGIDICRDTFGVKAEWVLDPVFLYDSSAYSIIADNSEKEWKTQYIAAYILDYSSEKERIIEFYKEKMNLDVIVVTDPNKREKENWKFDAHKDFYEEDWIKFIMNATFVLTDSFHGMCMALIFQKQFMAFVNESRGSARFYDYANELGFTDHLIYDSGSFLNSEHVLSNINYEVINSKIERLRERSTEWLHDAVRNDNTVAHISTFDMNNINVLEKSRFLCEDKRIIKMLKEIGVQGVIKKIIRKIIKKVLLYFNFRKL